MQVLKKEKIDLDNIPGKLDIKNNGQNYTVDVVYGPTCLNTNPRVRSIWIMNIHGKVMCVPPDDAIKFITERSFKFRPATMDELPFVPAEKVFPMDPEKTRQGQEKANTNLTGLEVQESLAQNIEIETSKYNWPQLKKMAAEMGINTYQKTRVQIEEEINEKSKAKD